MGIYFRKAVSAGPFRFNFSKSGVGVSVGVKGFRVGTGPRGHYVRAGIGGVYYQSAFGRPGRAPRRQINRAESQPVRPTSFIDPSGVQMVDIESAETAQLHDEKFDTVLAEMNERRSRVQLLPIVTIPLAILAGIFGFAQSPLIVIPLTVLPPAWLITRRLDASRRVTVLAYDLDPDLEEAYSALCTGFDALKGCAGRWHIPSAGKVFGLTAWKRNAGASQLVSKKPTAVDYSLPSEIKSNILPPSLGIGQQTIFFLPDFLLVQDGGKLAAISYSSLEVTVAPSNFIEDGAVPSDTTVVGRTWEHPNKNGGPDRRFNSNRQLPICLYENVWLRSRSGLHELVQFSKPSCAAAFKGATDLFRKIYDRQHGLSRSALPVRPSLPPPTVVMDPGRTILTGMPAFFAGFCIALGSLGWSSLRPPSRQVGPMSADEAPAPVAIVSDESQPVTPQIESAEPVTLFTTAVVRLRSGPSTDTAAIVTIPSGTEVSSTRQDGQWRAITYHGKEGWIRGDYLSEQRPDQP